MEKLNLNELSIKTDGIDNEKLKDFSISTTKSHFNNIEAIFKNIEYRLLEIIEEYKDGAIFGCIAWLTSIPILKALSKCKIVQIVVQKEDFLRPDQNQNYNNKWKIELREHYNNLRCEMQRHKFNESISRLSFGSDPIVEPVRCVGNHNSNKNSAFPRSHHKFLVFCKLDKKNNYIPTALWTGSFNLTKNATNSFENVLFLTDNTGKNPIISAFMNEHHQIFALSEKLDWENDWTAPDFRIGS